MSEIKVPKDSLELFNLILEHQGPQSGSPGEEYDAYSKMLRERFAFSGQKVVPADAVVLTRKEAFKIWGQLELGTKAAELLGKKLDTEES